MTGTLTTAIPRDEYQAILLGEIGCERQIERMLEYTTGSDRLHTAYSFALMGPDHSARVVSEQLAPFVADQADSWPCWATSNHDVRRTASRWLQAGESTASQRALEGYAVLLATLLGTPCIYQGEELGLPEADLAFEDLVDPPDITFWPEFKGRDGCRTPMVWTQDAPYAGFSDHKPWLPVVAEHLDKAADLQQKTPSSLYSFYRRLLKWRQQHAVARRGTFCFLASEPGVIAYQRSLDDRELVVHINLGDTEVQLAPLRGELQFGSDTRVLKPGDYRVALV
jgi:alpha-glucosidase